MTVATMALALLLTAFVPVFASQDAPAPRQAEVQQWIDDVKERLALTPEQLDQIRPVLEDELGRLKALREKYGDGGQSRRERRAMAREFRQIRQSADERLRGILTKEQMNELQKIREERREKLRGARRSR
jgi:Spy/CpxP family protein refolding chaperone